MAPKRVVAVRHAESADEAVNADLCFVPATHAVAAVLPAVSGSSGRLVVSQAATAEGEGDWPGRVFARADLSYAEAMAQFIAQREVGSKAKVASAEVVEQGGGEAKAERRALRAAELALRVVRGKERARRRLCDAASLRSWSGVASPR